MIRNNAETGYMYRIRRQEVIWCVQLAIDSQYNFVIDFHVISSNVHETVYLERLMFVLHHLGYPLEAL